MDEHQNLAWAALAVAEPYRPFAWGAEAGIKAFSLAACLVAV